MGTPRFIGLIGEARSGKDSFANYLGGILSTKPPYFTTPVRFGWADALKDQVCERFCISREYLEANKDRFRVLLQEWGIIAREIFGDDYWINQALGRPDIKFALERKQWLIVTDCRMMNEVNSIQAHGGILVRISRSSRPASSELVRNHITEQLDTLPFSFWVSNDGTKEDLLRKAYEFYEWLQSQTVGNGALPQGQTVSGN